MNMDELEQLRAENAKLMEELKRMYGVERPFVCGQTGTVDNHGLPDFVLIAPYYGADGFALYKKFKKYTEAGLIEDEQS